MIYIGIGSNLGHRKYNLRQAFEILCGKEGSEKIIFEAKISSIYESDALLPAGASAEWKKPFLNAVIAAKCDLEPLEFLRKIKNIELKMGRKTRDRWAPREIDIDILAWDNRVLKSRELTIPHPGMLERPFTLLPLAELSPNWTYPGEGPFQNFTIKDLLERWRDNFSLGTRLFSSGVFQPDLMGILNITPDSFSDGNLFFKSSAAIDQALSLVKQGAALVDIGAESTRPCAQPVSSAEEWARIEPVLLGLAPAIKNRSIQLSVDTRHPTTVRNALKHGVNCINDVTGFENPEMCRAVAGSDVDLVFMHNLGVPPNAQRVFTSEVDPVSELINWAEKRIEFLKEFGINQNRLIFDPGIGFGKSGLQSFKILKNISKFHRLGIRILVGHSRKSFLNLVTSKSASERDIESLTLSILLAQNEVHYLRVHNIEWHLRALKTLNAYNQGVSGGDSL